jgi:hypothetical protein
VQLAYNLPTGISSKLYNCNYNFISKSMNGIILNATFIMSILWDDFAKAIYATLRKALCFFAN